MLAAVRPSLSFPLLAIAAVLAVPGHAGAMCAMADPPVDAIDQAGKADVVFIGTARDGSTVTGGTTLVSPAVFDVQYHLGGKLKRTTEQVTTAALSPTSFVEDAIAPAAGEQWMIAGSTTDDAAVSASTCDPFNRRIDTSKAPVVTARGATVAPVLADLRGRPVVAGAVAPALPRKAKAFTAPRSSSARLAHGGHITKLRKRHGAWQLRAARKGDRIYWLDTNGIWAVRAG